MNQIGLEKVVWTTETRKRSETRSTEVQSPSFRARCLRFSSCRKWSERYELQRDHLDPGQNIVLTVKAELEGETLKLLAQSVAPIDAVADAVTRRSR